MADFNPVPPPPPPPRMNKPVPPPPPSGKAPSAPMTGQAPSPMPGKPAMAPMSPASSAPRMPGVPAGSAIDQKLQEMDRRVQEQDASKKALEIQINDLQFKLRDEHEKLMTQSIKAKEEEALSGRVEQQLREMQDKLRREKYEQELHDARGKAESQLKELERRMIDERETWMVALKNQLKERETVERETEQGLNRRMQDFEKRYQSEKNEWTLSLRQKDDEAAQMRRQLQFEIEKLQEVLDGKDDAQDELRETFVRERRSIEQQFQSELRALQAQTETQMREAGTWKAQVAMLQAQVLQSELIHKEEKNRWQGQLDQMISQQKEERTRWQSQLRRQEEDALENRGRLESQFAAKEEEAKREFVRRDNDRAKHWEDTMNQIRVEKEQLRHDLRQREDTIAKQQIKMAEMERDVEVERSEWRSEQEKIRRAAKEEALRELPVAFQMKIDAERKLWEDTKRQLEQQIEESQKNFTMRLETAQAQALKEHTAFDAQHRVALQELKNQLTRSLETQKALTSKSEIEEKRRQQDSEALQAAETMITALSQDLEAVKRAAELERTSLTDERAALEKTKQMQNEDLAHDMARLQNDYADAQMHWDRQVKEMMHRIAEAQLREESTREELTRKITDLSHESEQARIDLSTLKGQLETATEAVKQEQLHAARIQENLSAAAHNLDSLEGQKTASENELATLRADILKLTQQQTESKGREKDYEAAQLRLREAFNSVKTEMVQAQSERNQRESEWLEKENSWKKLQVEWDKTKADWEKTKAELESRPKMTVVEASSGGTVEAGPEAAKALVAIKQQMQEMQTLLTWMRPIKKTLGKAA